MNIEDHARRVIYNYPSLYRVRGNPELSRLHVFESLFFVIGTGYEWDKDKGILTDGRTKGLKKLPDGFFDKELYAFEVNNVKVDAFIDFLESKDCFHYTRPDHYSHTTTFIFETTEDEAKEWKPDWDTDRFGSGVSKRFVFVSSQQNDAKDIHPYPLCNYSAIVELSNKKTDSPHIENYSFDDFPIQDDWMAAAVEVTQAALVFYNDETRYCADHYHPNQSLGRERYDYNEAKKKPNGEAKYRKTHKYKEGETLEERSLRSFEAHRKGQIRKLEKFLHTRQIRSAS